MPAEFAELANLPEGCWLPEGLFESKANADYYAERLETLVGGAEPAVLLAMLTGSDTASLGYQETVEHLAAVKRVGCWLDARNVALEARLGQTALGQLPPPTPGCKTLRQRQLLAATSAAEELGCLLGLEEQQARARLDQATDLHESFPATLAAMEAGDLDRDQAAVIVVQGRSLPEEAMAGFEKNLLGRVKGRSLRSLRGMARRLRERTHPETIVKRRRRAEERRNVGVEPAPDGMAWLNAYLPAERAAAIDDRLTRDRPPPARPGRRDPVDGAAAGGRVHGPARACGHGYRAGGRDPRRTGGHRPGAGVAGVERGTGHAGRVRADPGGRGPAAVRGREVVLPDPDAPGDRGQALLRPDPVPAAGGSGPGGAQTRRGVSVRRLPQTRQGLPDRPHPGVPCRRRPG